MLARDVDSIPTQYRTWVVPNEPDFNGQFYTGLKSGNNPLVDIVAFQISDDNVIADFNLPLGADWVPVPLDQYKAFPVRKILPAPIEDSCLAIIDGYAYMFGGKVTASIYRASLNNPADWVDTGATLPTTLYGASLAIVGSSIYLFGGNTGSAGQNGITQNIYSAPVSDPLSWTNNGALLPQALQYSSLGMSGGNLYLFGGLGAGGATNVIYTASTSNPLVWTDTHSYLPTSIYGAAIAQVNNYWYLYGGQTSPNAVTNSILSASVSTPTFWFPDGYLPYATAFSQFVTMGTDGYLIGPMVGAYTNGATGIIHCALAFPTIWDTPLNPIPYNTPKIVPGVISHSQLAIIYDRIWLFGGSGELAVFCCNQNVKYDYYDPVVINYGYITRTVYQGADNAADPYQTLGFPYWKTSYSQ